jgi:hypothetical protein
MGLGIARMNDISLCVQLKLDSDHDAIHGLSCEQDIVPTPVEAFHCSISYKTSADAEKEDCS